MTQRFYYLFCIILLLTLLRVDSLLAQVHVRGYYRSNGTYVQPHERTRPNSTVTDNYSYPGNYNPNTGRVTGGTGYSIYSSPSYSNAPTNSSSASYTGSATSPTSSYKATSERAYTGLYKYRTSFDSPTISPPLRSSPDVNGTIIYSCPSNASVYLLEESVTDVYCKVVVNGYTGYVSKKLLSRHRSAYAPSSVTRNTQSEALLGYQFVTSFNNPPFAPPLRSTPAVESSQLYECPVSAVVYVLEDVPGSPYCKVKVDGFIGYVSKGMLRRQP